MRQRQHPGRLTCRTGKEGYGLFKRPCATPRRKKLTSISKRRASSCYATKQASGDRWQRRQPTLDGEIYQLSGSR